MGRPPIGARAMSPAERQRRHRAKSDVTKSKPARAGLKALQAQTQDNKVTVLKQELAQQRAMANRFLGNRAANVSSEVTEFRKERGIKRDGLAMEALRAAMTKPTWLSLDSFEEQKNEALSTAHRLPIEASVLPERARHLIEEALKFPLLDIKTRERLTRLATDDRMRELLRGPEGVAESIIWWASCALGIFPLLRPPPRSNKRAALKRYQQPWEKVWLKHPQV